MRLDIGELKAIPGSHKQAAVTFKMEPVTLGGDEMQFDQPFTGTVEIWNSGDRLLVRAVLIGQVQAHCSRCLAEMTLPLHLSFEEEFIEGQPQPEPMEEDGERTVSYYSGDEIDFTDPFRENILLAIPMKMLCGESCRGLCQGCGANLNQGGCLCETRADVDPRLAALSELLRKPDSQI